MSILAQIETLEERVQQLLLQVGESTAINDFVALYTEAIIEGLGDLSAADIAKLDLDAVVGKALEEVATLINDDLAAEIQSSVRSVIDETTLFYNSIDGLQVPDLLDAVSRTKEVKKLNKLFATNIATMRDELREGTIEVMQSELAQGLLDRSDLEELIFQYADGKAHYARTNARLIVSSYNRIGREAVRQEADLTHGYYYGDARRSTRPFCLRCIDKVFTIQEIEQMDNGQLHPVKIYAGGWNCIHSWLWVDPEWDDELAAKINTVPISPVDEDNINIKAPRA